MASLKNVLPQEGTGNAGESLPASSGAGSPTVSGGGKDRHREEFPHPGQEGRREVERGDVSDASSQMSIESVTTASRDPSLEGRRKRCLVGAMDDGAPPKVSAAFRGRSRSYSDRRSRAEIAAARRDEAERLVIEMTKRAIAQRVTGPAETTDSSEEGAPAEALKKQAEASVSIIREVATKSGNLKGTFVKSLKEAATSIEAVVSALHRRSTTEETQRLQALNERLEARVAALERETAELRAAAERAVAPATVPTPAALAAGSQEEMDAAANLIMRTVGPMLNARFEGIQDRLLPEKRRRPPLAADRRTTQVTQMPLPSSSESEDEGPQATTAIKSRVAEFRKSPAPAQVPAVKKGKKRGKRKSRTATPGPSVRAPTDLAAEPPVGAQAERPQRKSQKSQGTPATVPRAAPPAPRPLPPAPQLMDEPWVQVARRGAKSGRPNTAAAPPQVTRAPAKPQPRLRPPRSAAVQIKLKPGVEESGVTYKQVLTLAREKVDIQGLGIAGVKIRRAATGARILEVSGDERDGKANALASKIREVLDPQLVEISRPQKTAEVRVRELDDSVNAEDIRAAVARVCQCAEDEVKVGEVKEDYSGTRSALVRCPVVVARRLTAAGARLLVGWSSAKVVVLPPRPLQCYRCFEVGHVGLTCTAEVDRSASCLRCGKPGHKAGQCVNAPHCVLCAGLGKPAGHRVGNKACFASQPNIRRGRRAATRATVQTQPAQPAQPSASEEMEVGATA
ncbi:hypothetical protein ABMA27_008184 [Loxostege sticticalis]|uniref:CCHC-type domain-containing protein n=1 Tax=Loxostege sticticalis TaxID=481309 RepID=A0ABR3HEC1_LOXSC